MAVFDRPHVVIVFGVRIGEVRKELLTILGRWETESAFS
jgi:hypothetical protein